MDRNGDIKVLKVQDGFVHYAMNPRNFHQRFDMFDNSEGARAALNKKLFEGLANLKKEYLLETNEVVKEALRFQILKCEEAKRDVLMEESEETFNSKQRTAERLFMENERLNKPDLI